MSQPLLGAPFGQVYHDWKSADNLHHIFAAAVGLVVKDFGVVMNLYFLLGFIFAGVTAAWFLRLVGVSRLITIALAVLYAIAPYHFIRGETHMWLAAYYPLPLALGVVYLIARGLPLWRRNERFTNPVLGWIFSRATFTIFALALVGTANSYYAFWIVLFIAFAGLARFFYDHSWRRFLGAGVAGVFTVAIMVANMLPDILYSWANGLNTAAVVRFPVESEIYSLKLAQLILPQPGHRIPQLSGLRVFYDTVFPFPSESPALGAWAAIGFIAALGFALYATVTWGAWRRTVVISESLRSLGVLSSLSVFGFLLATFGGFSSLFSFLSSDLRGWNRMSIILAMLALAITGIILDIGIRFAMQKVTSLVAVQIVAAVVSLCVLITGYLDQVAPSRVPNYAATQQAFKQDETMVATIEKAVPQGSMILQVPFQKFPENFTNGVIESDQLIPYLHSETLRWSGGGIKGRPMSEWNGIAEKELTTPAFVDAATAAGFAGILFDRKLSATEADQVQTSLTETLGEPTYISSNGRYVFYTTASVRTNLEKQLTPQQSNNIGAWVVNPVLTTFEPDYTTGYSFLETLKPYKPGLVLTNPRTTNVELTVSLNVACRQGNATLRIQLPDGTTFDYAVSSQPQPITFTFIAPPGTSRLPFTINSEFMPQHVFGGDSGPIQVTDVRATDVQLVDALETIPKLQVAR